MDSTVIINGLDPDDLRNPFEASKFTVDNGKSVVLTFADNILPPSFFLQVMQVDPETGDAVPVFDEAGPVGFSADRCVQTISVPGLYAINLPRAPMTPFDFIITADYVDVERLPQRHTGGGASSAPTITSVLDVIDYGYPQIPYGLFRGWTFAAVSFRGLRPGIYNNPVMHQFNSLGVRYGEVQITEGASDYFTVNSQSFRVVIDRLSNATPPTHTTRDYIPSRAMDPAAPREFSGYELNAAGGGRVSPDRQVLLTGNAGPEFFIPIDNISPRYVEVPDGVVYGALIIGGPV